MSTPFRETPRWTDVLARCRAELAQLGQADRDWLQQRVAAIADLQRQLDALFRQAGGESACAACDGACCACGRHHLTLTNLLAYLFEEHAPPLPDFDRTCPFLGEAGCLLPVDRRPFNCITFLCETLEVRLSRAERRHFYALEAALRTQYDQVARRFPGASLRGLWIALERLADRPWLGPA